MINKVSKHIGNDPIRTDCNKCLCKSVCKKLDYYEYPWDDCKYFKDENHFIEVPFKTNEPMYKIQKVNYLYSLLLGIAQYRIVELGVKAENINILDGQWNKTIFQTYEEAEKALKELTEKD